MLKLTKEHLEELPPGEIFAEGYTSDDIFGCNMSGSRKCLKWVAVRGEGDPSWAIYLHWAINEDTKEWVRSEWIKRHGDKTHIIENIEKLVPCTDEALEMYRH